MRRKIMSVLLTFCFALSIGAQDVKFPYPQVPDLISQPQARLQYVLEHFWENYAFADTTAYNQTVGEQGFADFINIMGYADSAVCSKAVTVFVQQAFTDPWHHKHFSQLTDHYLLDPESPLRNDFVFLHFLKAQKAASQTEAERERLTYLAKNVAKNLPGHLATDFNYIDRSGRESTLYETKAPLTLLYLNDPDCETCQQVTARMVNEPLLKTAHLKVLFLYPDDDTDEWKRKNRSLPDGWIDAYSPNGEVGIKQFYFIQATPSIYLLDQNKRVLLKDVPIDKVIEFLKGKSQTQFQ